MGKKRRFLAGYVAQMPDMRAWEVTDEGRRERYEVQRKSRVVDSASGEVVEVVVGGGADGGEGGLTS